MAIYEHRKWWVVVIYMLLLISSLIHWVGGKPQQIPCYFIFGDSLVDNGNNIPLATIMKANYPPHGIDFPKGPTGRFCNGRTVVDVTAELLGFNDHIPPYASLNNSDILLGVNYASSGAGILKETSQHLGARMCLDKQLKNHQNIVSRISNILGNNDLAARHLNKCLYYVGLGSNDYINNYFVPQQYLTSRLHAPEEFATILIQQYHRQILSLYNYGARKVALHGLGPVGCTPNMRARLRTIGSSCLEDVNVAVQHFNNRLRSLVNDLNNDSSLTDAKFIYLNIYDRTMEVFANPSSFGLKETNRACCGVGRITCLPLQLPCKNRNEYLFWDAYHPTEAANVMAAKRSYKARYTSDAYPYDIHTLVQS